MLASPSLLRIDSNLHIRSNLASLSTVLLAGGDVIYIIRIFWTIAQNAKAKGHSAAQYSARQCSSIAADTTSTAVE